MPSTYMPGYTIPTMSCLRKVNSIGTQSRENVLLRPNLCHSKQYRLDDMLSKINRKILLNLKNLSVLNIDKI
jgi:hypothetical protein